MRYLKLLIIILIVGLTACEKEILYDDLAPDPLLVVNGLQRVGEPASLCVERSSFYIESESDFRVKDLHVDLFVNGVFKETLQVRDSIVTETYYVWDESGNDQLEERVRCAFNYCEGSYPLCEGDELRFEVSSSEFDETAVAETKMPYAPNIISFDTIRTEGDPADGQYLYFSLEIDDPSGNDYYNLYPKGALEGFVSSDPVFADFMNIVNVDDLFGNSDYYGRGEYNLFNDAYFDGTPYSVSMKVFYQTPEGIYYEPFTLEVTRVDDSFYQYKKSLNIYYQHDTGILGMVTEPTQVYSNVQHGVGLVGAQSLPVTLSIDFTENK